MEFRPCIDIHNGKVKQIVGSSLRDAGDQASENFVSGQDAPFYARMYQSRGIRGGHIILLIPSTAGFFEENAVFAISFVGICKEDAKFSRKEPQPEEQASFKRILVITPFSSQIAFISCPPISRINDAS